MVTSRARAGRAGRFFALAAAILAGGACTGTARATADVSIRPVGSLTFSWTGDPARGCVSSGVCGVHGSLTVQVGDSSSGGGPGLPSVELSDNAVVVHEQETSADGTPPSACADLQSVDFQMVFRRAHGHINHAAATPFGSAGWPSGGRCAGPTATDLSSLLLPARRLGSRGFDLSGTDSFGAGPYEVTAVSRIRALVEKQSFTSGSFGTSRPVRFHSALQETATVQYRIVNVQGTLGASFTGSGDSVCESLGTCGTSGAVSLALRPGGPAADQALSFSGARMVARRVRRRQALADLRGDRLPVGDDSFVVSLMGSLTDQLDRPHTPTCATTLQEPVGALSSRARHGFDRFSFAPTELGFPGEDLLRGYCAGPSSQDIVGRGALASGRLAVGAIGDRRLTLTLRAAGPFDAFGYVGTRHGVVRIALIRSRMIGGTSSVQVAGGTR